MAKEILKTITKTILMLSLNTYISEKQSGINDLEIINDVRNWIREEILNNDGQNCTIHRNSIIATFESVDTALECSISIQKKLKSRNINRKLKQINEICWAKIVIHTGDILIDEKNSDLLGKAVMTGEKLLDISLDGSVLVSSISQQISGLIIRKNGFQKKRTPSYLKNIAGSEYFSILIDDTKNSLSGERTESENFLKKIIEKNLIPAVMGYLAVAWGTIEAVSFFSQRMSLPDIILDILISFLMAFFPTVLVYLIEKEEDNYKPTLNVYKTVFISFFIVLPLLIYTLDSFRNSEKRPVITKKQPQKKILTKKNLKPIYKTRIVEDKLIRKIQEKEVQMFASEYLNIAEKFLKKNDLQIALDNCKKSLSINRNSIRAKKLYHKIKLLIQVKNNTSIKQPGSFNNTPSLGNTQNTSGISNSKEKIHRSIVFNFEFNYPENWNAYKTSLSNHSASFKHEKSGSTSYINIILKPHSGFAGSIMLNDLITTNKQNLTKKCSTKLELLEKLSFRINGMDAIETRYKCKSGNYKSYIFTYLCMKSKTNVVEFKFEAPEKYSKMLKNDFEYITRSAHFGK